MDDYARIQAAIAYMEAHLQEELAIADIARQAHFSPFHFQRVFRLISGLSVQDYVRRRRLSEAAKLLRSTGRPILRIAVDYQYGSHEAFTRAFADCFGIAPGAYRQGERDIPLQAPMNFLDYRSAIEGERRVDKPSLVELGAVRIVGCAYGTTLTDDECYRVIPGYYDDFGRNERYLGVPDRLAPAMAYGVACQFRDNGDFTFLIGEESGDEAAELPEGYMAIELPPGKYAVFKHVHAQDTRQYIYGAWLPNSSYERREGPDFEVTDVMRSTPEKLALKIYIPITG